MPSILYTSPKNVEFVRTDYKHRSKVTVRNADRSSTFRTYRFNNIPPYEHQYLSWANLDCCGGWWHDTEYPLHQAIQQHRKLVVMETLVYLDPKNNPSPSSEEMFDALNLDPSEVSFLCETVRSSYWNKNREDSYIKIARKGCLADFFNVQEILTEYEKHDIILDSEEIEDLKRMFTTELFDLFFTKQRDFSFSCVTPETTPALIATGLGFGYPIESTVSILNGE